MIEQKIPSLENEKCVKVAQSFQFCLKILVTSLKLMKGKLVIHNNE